MAIEKQLLVDTMMDIIRLCEKTNYHIGTNCKCSMCYDGCADELIISESVIVKIKHPVIVGYTDSYVRIYDELNAYSSVLITYETLFDWFNDITELADISDVISRIEKSQLS